MDYLRITDFGNRSSDSFCAAARIEKTVQNRDCGEDYILPDYLPDAKKVIQFTAKPIIETRFCGKGSLEYSGTIYFRLLYQAEGGELKSCSFQTPFEDRLTSEGISDDCVDFVSPRVLSSNCRLQNSRKVKASIRLSTEIEIWKRECFLPELYGASNKKDIACLETNPLEQNALNVTVVREDEMPLADDIVLDKTLPDISEIVFADVAICFDECRGGKKEVICRGGACLSCIYKGTDGKYYSLKRELPLSESIISDNAVESSVCHAEILCKTPDITPREDEFGQMRIIELNMTYSLEICIYNRKTVYLTSDAYSTNCECRNDYSDITLCFNEDKIGGNFSLNESLILKETGIGADDNIISHTSTAEMLLSNIQGKHGKLLFEGKCRIGIILMKSDSSVYPITVELPIKYECDRKFKENTEYNDKTACRVMEMRLRSDGEKLYADGEIAFSAAVINCEKHTVLSGIRLVPSSVNGKEKAQIIICYPSSNESIWDISKKYRVSRDDVSLENNINGSDLPRIVKIP